MPSVMPAGGHCTKHPGLQPCTVNPAQSSNSALHTGDASCPGRERRGAFQPDAKQEQNPSGLQHI